MLHFSGNTINTKNFSIRKDGYIIVYVPWHPLAWGTSKFFYLHRLIYENYLQRYLLPKEQVHHKDENKLNNLIENLELLDRKEHIKLHLHLEEKQQFFCIWCKQKVDKLKRKNCCSKECWLLYNKSLKISDEEILRIFKENDMVPIIKIAEKLNMSDNGLRKRLAKLGINTYKRQKQIGA